MGSPLDIVYTSTAALFFGSACTCTCFLLFLHFFERMTFLSAKPAELIFSQLMFVSTSRIFAKYHLLTSLLFHLAPSRMVTALYFSAGPLQLPLFFLNSSF